MKKVTQSVFIVVVLLVCILPFVCMAFIPTEATSENRELAEVPHLINDDQSFNVDVLGDAGAYFNDHYAFRNHLVSANAKLQGTLFGESATNQVVKGLHGWYYYTGTMDDYRGLHRMSDREVYAASHNLALMQAYLKAHNIPLIVVIAPNKNTLYDEAMPQRFTKGSEPSNADRTLEALKEKGVATLDLFALFETQPDCLYLKTDSHWNNQGALLASNEILSSLDMSLISPQTWVERDDVLGDLIAMVDPLEEGTETDAYAVGYNDGEGLSGDAWRYVSDEHDVTASWIETESAAENANGKTLMCYRDSFGNALLPYLASAFSHACFSKLVPYNCDKAIEVGADFVVVERAERHIDYWAENPPYAQSPSVSLELNDQAQKASSEGYSACQAYREGSYLCLQGLVNAADIDDSDSIYVGLTVHDKQNESKTLYYDAFLIATEKNGGSGYRILVPWDLAEELDETVQIVIVGEQTQSVAEVAIEWEQGTEESL